MAESGASRGRWAWALVPLLGSAAGLSVFGAAADEPPKAPPGASAPAPKPRSAPDHCLARFTAPLIAAGAARPGSPGAAAGSLEAELAPELGPGCSDLRVVIASVPDPIDSGLAYAFDTSLAALRLGAEQRLGDTAYYRDRSWLPWDDRSVPEAERSSSEECRSSTPGLLLFRAEDQARPSFLAVLLVGETPTSGLHAPALGRALELQAALQSSSCQPDMRIDVVGPTFSGSAPSLRRVLLEWVEQHPERAASVRIRTGTATGSALKKMLGSLAAETKPPLAPAFSASFAATTPPESAVSCAYLSFLYERLGVSAESGANGIVSLPEVAVLHESGTEFGATLPAAGACPLAPGVDISFPVHVSLLRDAYEQLDKSETGRRDAAEPARRTSLDISLREPRRPRDLAPEPSPKTTFAHDIALENALSTISRSGVRHVAIRATDIADAIFLARRIRDVSPDVRLAFQNADVLLEHAAFRRDLGGSLVVSAYPFLGMSPLADAGALGRARPRDAFESSLGLGVFNAMLVMRGARLEQLREYSFGQPGTVLPLWVATLGRDGFVPVDVSASLDPERTIELGSPAEEAPGRLLGARLRAEPSARIPRLWHFVFALLALSALIDQRLQRRTLGALSVEPMPEVLCEPNDAAAERAMVRTKWRLYGAIRSAVLAFALGYMGLLYALAFETYRGSSPDVLGKVSVFGDARLYAIAAIVFAAVAAALLAAARFAGDFRALHRLVRQPRSEDGAGPLVVCPVGFGAPRDRVSAAGTSLGQLTLLTGLALGALLAFCAAEAHNLLADANWDDAPGAASPSSTLLVMRSLTLIGGASAAAPTLSCVAIVYAWAVGRMARLRLLHGVSRVAPDTSVSELVCTPLSAILYPADERTRHARAEFAAAERSVSNALLRPVTGAHYASALGVLAFLPVVLFALKPLSTLERVGGTRLLASGLALAALLIGSTLIQLVQYWVCLARLLKLILQHRIGRSMARVARFVRDSVDEQVSRPGRDLLRLQSCVTRFDELVRSAGVLGPNELAPDERDALEACRQRLLEAREHAAAELPSLRGAAAAEAALGQQVLEATALTLRILTRAWDGAPFTEAHAENTGGALRAREPDAAARGKLPAGLRAPGLANSEAPPASIEPLSTDEALFAEAWRHGSAGIRWLRDAEAFGATVTALIVSRHVRQFQYFVYTLTACAILLLLALASYPFEPHRLLLTCSWVVVGSVVMSGLWVYLQMDRNGLLSRIAGSTPGKLTLDGAFALRVLTWGVFPLLSVAAVQYPELASSILRVIEPFTRALR